MIRAFRLSRSLPRHRDTAPLDLSRESRIASRLAAPVLAGILVLAACSEMNDHGRLKPYEPSSFFEDGKSARDLVPGTVPRDAPPVGERLPRQSFGSITELPMSLTADLLAQGRDDYDVFCSPCHGKAGYGDGMIVQRGFTPPPSFHIERLREVPIGHLVHVITQGYGAMYSYNDRLPLERRWGVAAYIRALQLSQHAPGDLLSEEEIREAERSTP